MTWGGLNQGLGREAVSSQVSQTKAFIIRTRPYIIERVIGEVKFWSGRINKRSLTHQGVTSWIGACRNIWKLGALRCCTLWRGLYKSGGVWLFVTAVPMSLQGRVRWQTVDAIGQQGYLLRWSRTNGNPPAPLCLSLTTSHWQQSDHLLLHIHLPNLMQLHSGQPKLRKPQAFPQDSEKSSLLWNKMGNRNPAHACAPHTICSPSLLFHHHLPWGSIAS